MRKSRFTKAQIIGMIKEQEAGMPMAEVWPKHGLNQGTFYKYTSKYGGVKVSDGAKMRSSEGERQRSGRCGITISRSAGPADLYTARQCIAQCHERGHRSKGGPA